MPNVEKGQEMGRLIDVESLWTDIMMLSHNGDMISSAEVEQAILDAPTIEQYGTWIPVSSGELPKEPLKSVIGWDEYRKCCVFVRYNGREWILGDYESVKIIAWMPTPSPYRGEER